MLLTSLRSEILKTRRTAAFYFTIFGAACVPLIFVVNVLFDELDSTRKDPFNSIFKLCAEMNAFVFYPLFAVLICTLLPQIEFKNNTWKQALASPQKKITIYTAKFLNIQLLLLLFLVVNHIFLFVATVITHFVMPDLDLLNQPLNGHRVFVNALNTYVCVLAISVIQFVLGLRFRNFIIPIAIGLVLWFTGLMMVFESKSPNAQFYPYSYQVFAVYPKLRSQLNTVEWRSLVYGMLVLALGFMDFRRRRFAA